MLRCLSKPRIGMCLLRLALPVQAAAAALLGLSALALHKQARGQEPTYGLSGSLGLGAVHLPTYDGSARQRTLAGPDFTLSYRSRQWGVVELGPRGLVWQAVEMGAFSVGLVAGLDPGRKAHDTRSTDPTPGDRRLAGMGDVRASAEAGLAIGYGPLTLVTHQSLGQRGHQGRQVELGLAWPWALNGRLGLRVSANAIWADAKVQQAFFGVTAAQASATGWPVFTPGAGLRKTELSLGSEYTLMPNTLLRGSVVASRLAGDAGRSPLVQRKSGMTLALAMVYTF